MLIYSASQEFCCFYPPLKKTPIEKVKENDKQNGSLEVDFYHFDSFWFIYLLEHFFQMLAKTIIDL